VPNLILERPWLADYQEAILSSKAQITITEACTKSGKTLSHSWWNVQGAHQPISPGAECLWIAPSHSQARMVFEEVARSYGPSGLYDINASTMTIRTPVGGVMAYMTGEKPNLIYGRSKVQQIVVDEYTRGRPEVFDVCISMLTATGGPLKLIGNYIGNANWGHVLKERMRGDPKCECFTITATDAVRAGIMKQERVDFARKTLHPSVFAALYMCEGSAHPLQLMRADAINDIWTNDHVEEGTRYIVADIARFGRDRTIIGIWSGLRCEDIIQFDQQDLTITASSIDNLARLNKVQRSHIVIDEGGVGGGVVDLLRGCMAFNGASSPIQVSGKDQAYGNLRAQCYYMLSDHVNEGLIQVSPECSSFQAELSMELESVRRLEDLAEGKLRIIKKDEMKEILGKSPDLGDMFMMRMLPELRGDSMISASIQRKGVGIRREQMKQAFRDSWR